MTWMPKSAEEITPVTQSTGYMPKSAEPIQQQVVPQQSVAQPIQQNQLQGQPNPLVNAFMQPASQTFAGQTAQTTGLNTWGLPIPQSQSAPFDSGIKEASNPLFRASDVTNRFSGGMIGNLSDQITTPANLVLGKVLNMGATALANNPVTRRFLQTQLPNLSQDLLKANPMEPIYKTINGIQADITKPLPPNAPRLVQIGHDLVDSIQSAIDTLGAKYKPLVGENLLTPEEVTSALPEKVATKLGINPADIKTTADLWQARTDLRTTIPDNAFYKGEFFKKNNLKEKDVMDMMAQMKGLVMNKMDTASRQSLDVLDNHYGNAIGAGKSLIKSIYNPNSGEVKTGSLMKMFDKSSDSAAGKQDMINKLNYFNSNVGKFSQQVITHVRNQAIKSAVGKTVVGGGLAWGAMRAIQNATNIGGEEPNAQ